MQVILYSKFCIVSGLMNYLFKTIVLTLIANFVEGI